MFYLKKDGQITDSCSTRITQEGFSTIYEKIANEEDLLLIENFKKGGYLKIAYDKFKNKLEEISKKYTKEERETFEIKRKEAEKMKEDESYISSFIEALCVEGETPQELMQKILDNSENYQLLYAQAEKQLREDLKIFRNLTN